MCNTRHVGHAEHRGGVRGTVRPHRARDSHSSVLNPNLVSIVWEGGELGKHICVAPTPTPRMKKSDSQGVSQALVVVHASRRFPASGGEPCFRVDRPWVHIPATPFTSCGSLDKWLYLPESLFPRLQSGGTDTHSVLMGSTH